MATYQFDQATHTTLLGTTDTGSTLYTGRISSDWTIGSVPMGGYVLSNLFSAVLNHYDQRYQKHPIALNSFFFGKTLPGPFMVEIRELKTSSKGYCICEASLKQHKNIQQGLATTVEEFTQSGMDEYMTVKVHGIFTMGNMDTEVGKTHYHKNPRPPSLDKMVPVKYHVMDDLVKARMDTSTLPHRRSKDGQGATVSEPVSPTEVFECKENVERGQAEISQSIWFADGRPIDVKSLAYYADMFIPPPALLGLEYWEGPIWCATMQLEILFKRIPENSPSLLSHFKVPHIINNRCDLDGELFDSQGNLLAVIRHQCLILDFKRSMIPKF